jgi:enterochelin esterase family protein
MVEVRGEWMKSGVREKLAKGEDGVWSVTLGPLEPDLYNYTLFVDGVGIADPSNRLLKQGLRGPGSLVDVPGPSANYHALRETAHGSLHIHHYLSAALAEPRRLHVYTPPGYETGTRKYPVLYLLHGSGDTDREWSEVGRAHWIADNLLSEGRMHPMIIVMPDGHAVPSGAQDRSANTRKFGEDLLGDILPLIERTYRVDARPEMRALAGLSMGGSQALSIGLAHHNRFAWFGVFSAGVREDPQFEALKDPAAVNADLKLFWIGMGKDDAGLARAQALAALLSKSGIRHEYKETEGAHTWTVWRRYLREFLPRLFREDGGAN